MEKIVEVSEKFNFKLFIVNLGILTFYCLSLLWEILAHMGDMKVSWFFHSLAIFAATAIAGVVTLSLMHMLLWYCCDQYKKSTGFQPGPTSNPFSKTTSDPHSEQKSPEPELKSEENKS